MGSASLMVRAAGVAVVVCLGVLVCASGIASAQATPTPTPTPTATATATATATSTPTPAPVFYTTLESGQAAVIEYRIAADGLMLGVLSFAQLVALVLILVVLVWRGSRGG